ncbi:MAG TPA: universal stress protein [Nocardioides sp.]|uniref:universal stress protein n=1 Tax=Nocardioides sp. TaxID=35761 RepID=UPI002D81038A|nr:universal stress protein [Nocardioides sp.]HET6653251.1 universal stress protein [Nocardioides sp.]
MTTTAASGAVVVGYDDTPHSDTALTWAVEHASRHRRPVLIVHALGVPTVYESFAGPVENRRQLRITGRRRTDQALVKARRLAPDLDVRVHLALGNARDVLLDSLEGAHLLVVGSRGRGTLASLLLGSVSVGVAAHSPCPVVVAREAERRDPNGAFAGRVVVGVDGSAASTAALAEAFELASSRGQPLAVVHAWDAALLYRDLTTYDVVVDTADEHQRMVAESLAGFAEKYPDVEVTVHQDEGDPGRAIVAASHEADLVVVGSRGRGDAVATLFGSVSRHVVAHAHCPVVVVRRPEGLS